MAHDVFVSYSSHDRPVAEAAVRTLEAANVRCWVAFRDVKPGAAYEESIVAAIEGCRAVVLVFSSHANASPHVFREMNIAADERRPVVPLRIEDVEMRDGMRYYLGSVHWLEATAEPMQPHLDRLVHAVTQIIGVPPPLRHAPAPRPAAPVAPAPAPLHVPEPPRPAFVAAPARRKPASPLKLGLLVVGGIVGLWIVVVLALAAGQIARRASADDGAPAPAYASGSDAVARGEAAWRQGRLDEAYGLLRGPADGGDRDAQHWLGHVCLSAGDRNQAASWFTLASENGHEEAGNDLRNMGM